MSLVEKAIFPHRWLLFLLLIQGTIALAQPTNLPRQDFWVTDGPVNAVVETNGVLYVGGEFQSIAPNGGRGGIFNIFSDDATPLLPQVNGAILSVISDQVGGWFVGGLFTRIGGVAKTNLAHILPGLVVDTNWSPNPHGFTQITQRSSVYTLLMRSNILYAGGIFTSIGGMARKNFAALDARTGQVLPWSADVEGEVYCLATRSNSIYFGGRFTSVQATTRNDAAAVDATTGQLLAWHPNSGSSTNESVNAIAPTDEVIFVGGYFGFIGGAPRTNLAALDLETGLATSWNVGVGTTNSQGVQALAVSCSAIYVGGVFTNVGAFARNNIAALDPQTGIPTAWNPNANSHVYALLLSGNTVFAGGRFTSVGGQTRFSAAALSTETGLASGWNPRGDRGVVAMALVGNNIFIGGGLAAGGLFRKNLAAFDVATGEPLEWNPGADAPVNALAISGSTVYVGGDFTHVSNQERRHLAAINATNGQVLSWRADLTGLEPSTTARTLSVGNNALYVGGRFTEAKSLIRYCAAALDLVTAAPTTFAPYFNNTVRSLVVDGSSVYAGGLFSAVYEPPSYDTPNPRSRLAQVNANSGLLTSWNPSTDGSVLALAVTTNKVYAGGLFTHANGVARSQAAAFDRASTNLLNWNPNLTGGLIPAVFSFAAASNAFYVGGAFAFANGEPRQGLAVVDPITGVANGFDAQLGDLRATVFSMALRGSRLFAGGIVLTIGDEVRLGLSEFVEADFPRFLVQPAPKTVAANETVVLESQAFGQLPLAYQWQRNGTNIPGATNLQFQITNAYLADSGIYRVIVTNDLGRLSSLDAAVTVLDPLVITTQPISQTVAPGASVTLSVGVAGNPPPSYQWRLNGVNIQGSVSSTLTFTNIQRTNGGSYDVVVANVSGAVLSDTATLLISGPTLPFADNLADRGVISGASGSGGGNSQSATMEPGEPLHAGKPGGKSLWLSWTPSASGIATFHTRGSAFDTLLAVYTGTGYSNLVSVARDEDRGGFGTSEASFNALSGTEYLIAVDGFASASGNVLLTWTLDTSTVPFPRIITQPLSWSISAGALVNFAVDVNSDSPVTYQWFHECRALIGQTNATLTISNVQPQDVGGYHLIIVNASSRTARSEDAFLEIGPDANALSKNKLEDLLLGGGAFSLSFFKGASPSAAASGGFIPVGAGMIGSQLFDNVGAATQQGEPIPCGVIGGSSKWMGFLVATNAVMMLDTIGSSFDTVVAVYVGSSFANLSYVACDNNSAPDSIRSRVRFPTVAATSYLVAVDGVNGAQGNVSLNWRLAGPPVGVSSSSNRIVNFGDNAVLAVNLNNPTADTLFLWRLNGNVISSTSSNNLVLSNMQSAQAGTYSVIVSNFAGMTNVEIATLKVAAPIQISGTTLQTNDVRVFRLIGPSSERWIIEGATSLREPWLPIWTNSSGSAPIDFIDWSSTNLPARFYRVVPP